MVADPAGLMSLVEEARPHIRASGAAAAEWLDRLDAHHAELTSLIEQLLGDEPASGAEMAGAVWPVWWLRDHMEEGQRLLSLAAAATNPPRTDVLKGLGTLAFHHGDLQGALGAYTQRLAQAQADPDKRVLADACGDLSRLELRRGNFAAARQYADRGYHAAVGLEPEAMRLPLHLRAAAAHMDGQLDVARALYLESRSLNERLGNAIFVAAEDHNLGTVALDAGDREEAEQRFEAASRWIFANDNSYLRPYAVLEGALLALYDGDLERSARLLGAVQKIFEETEAVPDPDDQQTIDRALARLREGLALRLDTLLAEGRMLNLRDAQAATGWERRREPRG